MAEEACGAISAAVLVKNTDNLHGIDVISDQSFDKDNRIAHLQNALNITEAHHVDARNSVFNQVGGNQINITNRMTTINIVADRDGDGYEKIRREIESSQETRAMDQAARGSRTVRQHPEVTPIYDVPRLRVSHFVPRKELLARLEESFPFTFSGLLVVVLLGMGGAGKSQLALDWCRRMRVSGKFKAIFWLDASTRHSLLHAMDVIAKRLAPLRQFEDPQTSTAFVIDALSGWTDPWLMVFDNLDNPANLEGIEAFLPSSDHGFILVTSRYAGAKELGQSIELDGMEREEGLRLLLGPRKANADVVAAAKDILNRLGDLPLAIDQARAYMSRRKLSPRAFLDEFKTHKETIMKETPRYWLYQSTLTDHDKTPQSLFTTWEMSLALLGGVGDDVVPLKDILTLFGFFHNSRISEKMFSANSNLTSSPMRAFRDGTDWDHFKFQDAVTQLQELSLLQFSHHKEDGIVISLHPMVSEWLRIRCDESSRRSSLADAVRHLTTYMQSTTYFYYESRQELLSHLNVISALPEFGTCDIDFIHAHHAFGDFYEGHNQFNEAERMYKRALADKEAVLGPDHMSTLDTVHQLGKLYARQDRFDEAWAMYDRALAGKEKALGPEDMSTLDTVHQLGKLYARQDRFDEAWAMYDRALAGKEKALGPEDISTFDTVHEMGSLCVRQGRFDEARRMYDRALAGKDKALGPDDISTLDTVHKLGNLNAQQGYYDEAWAMYNRALAGKEKALGPEHTSTLGTAHQIGNLHLRQCRFDEARSMYDRALAGREKALGPNHTFTADTVHQLGSLYARQGRYDEAWTMYNRALAVKEKALGPEHMSTLDTVHHIGNLHVLQGRFDEALSMYNRALAGREKALGPDHTSTVDTVHQLGNLHTRQGHFDEAWTMYNRALVGKEKALGPEHPSTLDTLHQIGNLYVLQGRFDDAQNMYARALAGREKTLGPDHASTLDTIDQLGHLYARQGHLYEAKKVWERALTSLEKALGSEHPRVVQMRQNCRDLELRMK